MKHPLTSRISFSLTEPTSLYSLSPLLLWLEVQRQCCKTKQGRPELNRARTRIKNEIKQQQKHLMPCFILKREKLPLNHHHSHVALVHDSFFWQSTTARPPIPLGANELAQHYASLETVLMPLKHKKSLRVSTWFVPADVTHCETWRAQMGTCRQTAFMGKPSLFFLFWLCFSIFTTLEIINVWHDINLLFCLRAIRPMCLLSATCTMLAPLEEEKTFACRTIDWCLSFIVDKNGFTALIAYHFGWGKNAK